MADYRWEYNDEGTDWEELSELYRIAPLGVKPPNDLALVSRTACSSVSCGTVIVSSERGVLSPTASTVHT